MRATQLLEARQGSLWHGFKDPEYAIYALKNNKMEGRTPHRWWPDRWRRDDEEGYSESYWMKGISTTRNPGYAAMWGVVVFELDQAKIDQTHKILPMNWGGTIALKRGGGSDPKKEAEEYVVTYMKPDDYMDPIDDEDPEWKEFNYQRWKSPEGRPLQPLTKYLKAIYTTDYYRERTQELIDEGKDQYQWAQEEIAEYNYFINHPLYAGEMKSERPKRYRKKLGENIKNEVHKLQPNTAGWINIRTGDYHGWRASLEGDIATHARYFYEHMDQFGLTPEEQEYIKQESVGEDADPIIRNIASKHGWVRVIHKAYEDEDTNIQGETLREVARAARLIDKQVGIDELTFDVGGDADTYAHLSGRALQMFLKTGRIPRTDMMMEGKLNEFKKIYGLTGWVNPSRNELKQLVTKQDLRASVDTQGNLYVWPAKDEIHMTQRRRIQRFHPDIEFQDDLYFTADKENMLDDSWSYEMQDFGGFWVDDYYGILKNPPYSLKRLQTKPQTVNESNRPRMELWAVGPQRHRAKFGYMQDSEDNSVVWADIVDLFRHTNPDQRLDPTDPTGGANRIGDRVEHAMQHWREGGAMDPAEVAMDFTGMVSFRDGRHRLVAAYRMGEQWAPVVIPEDDVREFRSTVKTRGYVQESQDKTQLDEAIDIEKYIDNIQIEFEDDDVAVSQIHPQLEVQFNRTDENSWNFELHSENIHSLKLTGKMGTKASRIYGLFLASVFKFLKLQDPDVLEFSAASDRQAQMYKKLGEYVSNRLQGYDVKNLGYYGQITKKINKSHNKTQLDEAVSIRPQLEDLRARIITKLKPFVKGNKNYVPGQTVGKLRSTLSDIVSRSIHYVAKKHYGMEKDYDLDVKVRFTKEGEGDGAGVSYIKNEDAIVVTVRLHKRDLQNALEDPTALASLASHIARTVAHETVHVYQRMQAKEKMSRRSGQMGKFVEPDAERAKEPPERGSHRFWELYLADRQEIEAHAAEAVVHFLYKYGVKEPEKGYQKFKTKMPPQNIEAFDKYWHYFGQHKDSVKRQRVWRRFLKKMEQHFQQYLD